MKSPFYVTTPIYYVNDKPHIGHAYTTIAADLLARFYRMAGRETFFMTGTDEHGSKVAEVAESKGKSPQAFVDEIVENFKSAWKLLDVEEDYFIRTTSERHEAGVTKVLKKLHGAKTPDGQDVIYTDYYEGLYCTGCEKFITEKELVDGLCPDHLVAPKKVREKNYFFRLSAFVDTVREKIESNELQILPDERRREVLGLIKQGVPDFSLSRENVTWGVPLPFDKSQVTYVWVDALLNYITGIGYGDDEKSFAKWWQEGEVVHLMAKDILKFHCLFWPSILLALGVDLPKTLFLHGFFTIDGQKMSKSLGNQIPPADMVEEFGPDGTRYLLLSQYPFGVDGDVQASRFIQQYNSDLANDLGNLVSRVGKMVKVHFDCAVPPRFDQVDGLSDLVKQGEGLVEEVTADMAEFRLTRAVQSCMALVKATNKFFADTEPWIKAREDKKDELAGILRACCESIRITSILLYPLMPRKMKEIRSLFGLNDDTLNLREASAFYGLPEGATFTVEDAVFPRLEQKKAKPEKKADEKTEKTADEGDLITIDDVGKVQLRVAQVLEAEKVEGADKLLKLQIDLGSEKRQIIAGVAEHYTPEEMVGKRIVVIANLQPAVIRGIESNGMLLAAKKGKKLCLVTPEADLPPGSKIS